LQQTTQIIDKASGSGSNIYDHDFINIDTSNLLQIIIVFVGTRQSRATKKGLIINSLESSGAAALHSNLHRKLLFCILTRENYQVSLSIDSDIILNCAPQWLSQLTDIHT